MVTRTIRRRLNHFDWLKNPALNFLWLLADLKTWSGGNRPLEPRAFEVEFFPMEEVLYKEIEIQRQPDDGRGQTY